MAERKKVRTMKTAKEVRALSPKERSDELEKLKEDLMHEKGIAAMGGAPMSPGKIRSLRKSIARHLTIIGGVSRAEAAKASEKKVKKAKKKVKAEEKGDEKEAKKPKEKKE